MRSWWAEVAGETRDERAMVLVRCAVFAGSTLVILYVAAHAAGLRDPVRSLVALGLSVPIGVAMHVGITLLGRTMGGGLARATGLSGHGTRRGGELSQLQALVVQGRVADALAEYERIIAASPRDYWVRLQAADVHARAGGDPARAATLFREARQLLLAQRERRDDGWRGSVLYATQRLIDLYDGPLEDEARAMTELRRIVQLFPDTPEARGAQQAIERRRPPRDERP